MHDSFHYRAYGVTLRSNRALPGLTPGAGAAQVAIDFAGLRNGHFAAMTEPSYRAGIESFWRIDDANWHLRHTDFVNDCELDVRLADRGTSMTIRWTEGAEVDDIVPVLQGHVFGALLHLRGVPLLHASVIAAGERAIAILGEAGAGKSTTAAAFVSRGYPLVSDDLAALDIDGASIRVHAGYPRLRIHADSARALGWSTHELPRVFITGILGDKRYVDLKPTEFCASSLPLAAIYLLQRRRPGAAEAEIESVPEREALAILLRNIYSPRLLDAARKERAFRALATVAHAVPVTRVRAADSFEALPGLIETLVRTT